jgi:hypothetical protein
MKQAVPIWFFAGVLPLCGQPLPQVLELDSGATETVQLPGGKPITVKLLGTSEGSDRIRSAVRAAQAEVTVNGERVVLSCGNYQLPVAVAGVRIDCPITKAYYRNTRTDHWGLAREARLRLWPSGALLPPGSMVYPVRQKWFATQTQMANEPTYVDGGERFGQQSIYYHSGLDIGGAEGLTEVVAATGGLVVALGTKALEEHKTAPLDLRNDETVYVLDERGWYHRYTHLHSYDPAVKLGERVKMGQRLGLLGKEGSSGGWAHLHYEILSRQPSGKWGTQEGYALLWEAYIREHRPELIAVARPHRIALTGEEVELDGSGSWSVDSKISRYDWTFTDGGKASGARVRRTYSETGNYTEILKVTDGRGRTEYDFTTVIILDASRPDRLPPAIHAAYWPTTDIRAGQPVTFKARTFGTTEGEETWEFGDGSPAVRTKSDGNVNRHAKDGYAVMEHAYRKPGDYLVSVGRANAHGKAVARLHVRVGRSR